MQSSLFRPPPELSVSAWSDEYRYLSSEANPEPGKWHTDRAPYQREMMDAIKRNERVVIMTSAQVGKSELLLNTIGYYADQDPSPMLMIQPTLQMGEGFSKERLYPMLRDTPCLSSKINLTSRNPNNTLLYKKFMNGAYITIAGANSPASLASRPIRILLCDEVDRYPDSAKDEGDPLSIAIQRTTNFWNRHIVMVSTPKIKGMSRIQTAYEQSTQEVWNIPCPRCGEYQTYDWERIIYQDKTQPVMRCVNCGQEFGQHDWSRGAGKWIASAPDEEVSVRGFHMNAFASPWVKWSEIVWKYHEAYNTGEKAMQVWVNTVLGEPYELREGSIDVESISQHKEDYVGLPEDVEVLTCGIDVQDNRLELEVLGWGSRFETWGIEYRIIYGTPGNAEVWDTLDEYLMRTWEKASGERLGISCTCIDSGGHFTDSVYKFVQGKSKRRIYAIVGRGAFGHPTISGPTRNNRRRVPLFTLGVSTLKGMLFSRLQAERGEAGYCHFPSDETTGYDAIYYKGLLSERMVIERKNGQDRLRWEVKPHIKRNEPLDCRVYAMGAYEILNPKLMRRSPTNTQTVDAKPKASRRRLMVRRMMV